MSDRSGVGKMNEAFISGTKFPEVPKGSVMKRNSNVM